MTDTFRERGVATVAVVAAAAAAAVAYCAQWCPPAAHSAIDRPLWDLDVELEVDVRFLLTSDQSNTYAAKRCKHKHI